MKHYSYMELMGNWAIIYKGPEAPAGRLMFYTVTRQHAQKECRRLNAIEKRFLTEVA